ncbi:MarR family transcriptional regulator [Actinoplanes sp. NPDC049548]|uniref:MarR family winged helix-turn-helix transcriptional regulator n=1 Tax=Actinoplanes sp. NPDC049548 TaxID=3155152 RepID=UPI0034200897
MTSFTAHLPRPGLADHRPGRRLERRKAAILLLLYSEPFDRILGLTIDVDRRQVGSAEAASRCVVRLQIVTDARDVFDRLVSVEIAFWERVDARLRAEGRLALGQLLPMRVMATTPRCRVFDIAAQLQITVGAASKTVDRVEAAGHCVRRPNPADRRSSLIEMTEAGVTALADAEVVFEDEVQARVGAVLSPAELVQLVGLLDRLREAAR